MNIEERVEKAKAYFAEGYNCSQAVFLAYADFYNLDPEIAAVVAAPLGGGVGRMREICGAVSGMALVTGLKYKAGDPKDKAAKMKNYAVVREVSKTFEEQFGSVVGRELLSRKKAEVAQNTEVGHIEPKQKGVTCAVLVETAARIVGERMLLD